MNLTDYLRIRNLEPASKDAVCMGCKCIKDKDDSKVVIISRRCPFHWHFALQADLEDMGHNLKNERNFNKALKTGYVILALFLAGLLLYKS
jgi:hypothetical protein